MNRGVIDTLDQHFHCLDEQVACSRVRSFLPGLARPSVPLRIPTPITVHVDQCPQCTRDLNALRGLSLRDEQLERLHWLYGHERVEGFLSCRRARSRIAAFVRGSWAGIDAGILDHLSTCPRCRAEIFGRREVLLDELSRGPAGGCAGAAAADLFDFAVPRGDLTHDGGPRDPSHVGTCRPCLETIQRLHHVIYGVAERPDSGVATVYSTVDDAEAVAASPSVPYSNYPIRVRVIRHEPAQVPAASRSPATDRVALKAAPANRGLAWSLKAAVAAAAVIPLVALFLCTHGASGITLAEVFHAFGQARNVRVVGFDPAVGQVSYELWVARGLNREAIVTKEGGVIYDLARKERETIGLQGTIPVGDKELANVRKMADSCLGFTLADVPAEAKWMRVSANGDREVYELTWTTQTYGGRSLGIKYEVAIACSTMLPESLRVFFREPTGTTWECRSLTTFEYLTEAEMRSVMAGESF